MHGAGRSPDIEYLALEKAGIDSSRQGIKVNTDMTTTNSRVYAVGDCAGTVQLAPQEIRKLLVPAQKNFRLKRNAGQVLS